MSEKNNIFENDLLMRAILEGGQEEVPGHIWDAVSDGLDKAAEDRRRKTVTLWWRRAGVSVAAVAAAVASVLVLSRPEPVDIVPAAMHGDMIAVVESAESTTAEDIVAKEAGDVLRTNAIDLVAYVPEKTSGMQYDDILTETGNDQVTDGVTEATDDVATVYESQEVISKPVQEKTAPKRTDKKAAIESFPDIWEDEHLNGKQIKTAVIVSGITGASGSQGKAQSGMLKAPALTLPPAETGIKERNTQSTYGLPVSVGAGVKIEFTPRWSLGVGVNYTYLTRTFSGTYTHVNEAGTIDDLITSDIRNSQHYIGIPVNAYYNILNSKHVNFYAYAGGAVEKCVYDKYLVLTNSFVHKEPAKGVQLSANLGVGAEFMLGQHIGLYIDPSLRYYFDCDQPKSIRTAQPLMLGFELGFRFRL